MNIVEVVVEIITETPESRLTEEQVAERLAQRGFHVERPDLMSALADHRIARVGRSGAERYSLDI